jgi:hypothetical protein
MFGYVEQKLLGRSRKSLFFLKSNFFGSGFSNLCHDLVFVYQGSATNVTEHRISRRKSFVNDPNWCYLTLTDTTSQVGYYC